MHSIFGFKVHRDRLLLRFIVMLFGSLITSYHFRMGESARQLSKVRKKAVREAMSCVYWLAKEEIPHMTRYKPLLELVQHLGLPFMETLQKGANSTCTSHRMTEEFLSITSYQVKRGILEKICNSPCFRIICEETTDIATTSQQIVYLRLL